MHFLGRGSTGTVLPRTIMAGAAGESGNLDQLVTTLDKGGLVLEAWQMH